MTLYNLSFSAFRQLRACNGYAVAELLSPCANIYFIYFICFWALAIICRWGNPTLPHCGNISASCRQRASHPRDCGDTHSWWVGGVDVESGCLHDYFG